MTSRSRTELGLVKLSDSDFTLEDPAQDIRGKDVYNDYGERVGRVDELYIDGHERKVCFLDVSAEGFLSMREKHFLVQAEVVTGVGEARVTIEPSDKKVVGSSSFDAKVVPSTTDQRPDVREYYGETDPFKFGDTRDRYPGGGAGLW
jgi:sporulation protein YlmC with PRC-barrel domain